MLIGAYLVADLSLAGSTLAGSTLAGDVWKAALAMWCVTAFGYASNDLFDITEDRINKPDRPLPSGAVTQRSASLFVIGLAVVGIAISWSIGWLALAAACCVMTLLTVYNLWLKGKPLQGNFLISGLASCTLFVGGVAQKGIALEIFSALLLPALILASFVITREILKTIEDEAGDAIAGKQTVTTKWNSQSASRILTGSALITIFLLALPVWLYDYSILYLAVAWLGVGCPLLYTIFFLHCNQAIWRVRRCLILLKGSYFAGILALWLA